LDGTLLCWGVDLKMFLPRLLYFISNASSLAQNECSIISSQNHQFSKNDPPFISHFIFSSNSPRSPNEFDHVSFIKRNSTLISIVFSPHSKRKAASELKPILNSYIYIEFQSSICLIWPITQKQVRIKSQL
jgi:hypothetical protein